MRLYESKYAVCPFYRGEESTAIFCEGPVERTSVKMIFPSRESKVEYRRTYCEAMSCWCVYGDSLITGYK